MGGLQRGVSLFELVVVVILVVILILVAIARLMPVLERVERVAMELDVAAMRRALGYELSRLVIEHRFDEVARLDGSNPMRLLATVPNTYAGELSAAELGEIAPGSWYFEVSTGELVYRPRHIESFRSELGGPTRIRFRISVEFEDRDGDGSYRYGVDELRNVGLASRDAYEWGTKGGDR